MDEVNKLTSNFWLGIFKVDTNLSVELVRSKFTNVTSHKTSLISIENKEVRDNRDKYLYSGNINNNELYLHNLNSSFQYETVIQGSIKKVLDGSSITMWVRPAWFYLALFVVFLLLLFSSILVYDVSSNFLESALILIAWLVLLYAFYLMEVSTQKKTIQKLFNIKKPEKS